jgi:hypothetical protein
MTSTIHGLGAAQSQGWVPEKAGFSWGVAGKRGAEGLRGSRRQPWLVDSLGEFHGAKPTKWDDFLHLCGKLQRTANPQGPTCTLFPIARCSDR